jgi:hypothetical protein
MTKMKLLSFAAILLAFIFVGCKKDKEEITLFDDTLYGQESTSAYAEKSISDDEDALTLRSGSGDCNGLYVNSCAVITEDNSTFPKTITIDYGTGCTDWQGRTKTGKIFIHLTDSLIHENAVRTVTFENFTVNGTSISGSRITTNIGLNANNQMVFNRIIDTDISNGNGTFQRNFNEQITWVSGFNNDFCGDNVLSITGEGSVTRPSGVLIPREIVTPLVYDQSCGYIISGVIEIYSLQGVWSVNYGDGNCDNDITITRPNGTIVQATL